MTADAYTPVVGASPVEALLAELLDREWQEQSARTAPLGITAPVRAAVELVFAGTPQGIFAVVPELRYTAASPHQLIDRVRDALPAEVSPWTLRALRRTGALRAARPLLPATDERPALGPAPVLEPPTVDLPPVPGPLVPVDHELSGRHPRAVATASACGAIVGAPIGLVSAGLDTVTVAVGAAIGALAATIGAAIAARTGRRGAER